MKVCNKYFVSCSASNSMPARLKHGKIGRGFCAGAAFCTAMPKVVSQVQPISAATANRRPRNPNQVHQVDMPGDAPPMIASVRRQLALQEFAVVVPFSRREPGPGVWNNEDAEQLMSAAASWNLYYEHEREMACMLLWRCFNSMFPADSQANADEWGAEQWYEPRVRSAARHVFFACQSVDNRCWVRFSIANNYVLIHYRGPVHFDLSVVDAARSRARDDAIIAANRHHVDVWDDVTFADDVIQREQELQNAFRADQRARDEAEERMRERARIEALADARRQQMRNRAAQLDEWEVDEQDD